MSPDDQRRIGNAVVRTERQPLGNPIDDGSDWFRPGGAAIIYARVTGDAICGVSNLSGSGSTSGSGGGPCNNRVWPAVILQWDHTSRCFTDLSAVWLFDLNDADLASGTRYTVRVVEGQFRPQCSGSDSGSGSGSSGTQDARTLCSVLTGTSAGPGIIITVVDDVCFFPVSGSGSGSGSDSGVPPA